MVTEVTGKIIVLGDIHAPFTHKANLLKVLKIIKDVQPKYVVQIGDLYDFYAFSRFARRHDLMTPKQEMLEGRSLAEMMWYTIKTTSPKSVCYQLRGNHDERPIRRTLERFPEIASLIDVDKLFIFPQVNTIGSEREELILDGIVFMHGYRRRLGDHCRHNLECTVTGHSHQGGVFYMRRGKRVIWELNAGYLADSTLDPFNYMSTTKFNTWTQGFGYIDEWGPRFISFEE